MTMKAGKKILTLIFAALMGIGTGSVFSIQVKGEETPVSVEKSLTIRSRGDINGDGEVDSADLAYLRRYLAGWSGYEIDRSKDSEKFTMADVNADEEINGLDVILLRRYLAEWEDGLSPYCLHKNAYTTWDWSKQENEIGANEEGLTASFTLECADCRESLTIENIPAERTTNEDNVTLTCGDDRKVIYTITVSGTQYTDTKEIVIGTLAHTYGTPEYSWDEEEKICTASIICTRCKEIEKENAKAEGKITAQSTCTEKGETTYTAHFDNDLFETQTRKWSDVEALGHDYIPAAENACTFWYGESGYEGEVTFACANCQDTQVVKAEIKKIEEESVSATCTQAGKDVYRIFASMEGYENADFEEKKEVILSAIGHSYSENWTESTTEGREGMHEKVCAVCRDTIYEAHEKSEESRYTEHTQSMAGYTTYSCVQCGAEIIEEDADIDSHHIYSVWEQNKAPTAEEKGEEKRICSVCKKEEVREIPALGHSFREPTESDWKWTKTEDAWMVTLERQCVNCTGDKAHTESSAADVVAKETEKATCTDEGEILYTATVVLDGKEYQNVYKQSVDALGHSYDAGETSKEAACTEDGVTTYTCQREGCSVFYTKNIPSTGHTAVSADNAKAATCTETGKESDSVCSVCQETLSIGKEIPALGHTEVTDAKIEPTCTATGLTEGKHCGICGEVLTAQQEIPALDHTEVIDEAKAATCTATGLTEGKHCSVCNAVLIGQDIVPAKGHAYQATGEWAEDNVSCTFTLICQNDASHEVRIDNTAIESQYQDGKAPTCQNGSVRVYIARAVYGGVSYSITKEVEEEKLSHEWVVTDHSWNVEEEEAVLTIIFGCDREDCEETKQEDLRGETISVETITATCQEEGRKTYSAIYDENTYSKTVELEKLAHTAVSADNAKAATCTETGKESDSVCSVCQETLSIGKEIPALGHTEVTDAKIEPTCTATGLTEGKHCGICGEELTAQQEIPALGHTEVTDAKIEPTCTATGLTEGKHCGICGEELTAQQEIPALGHSAEIDEAKAATCTATGLTEGKHCGICGEVLVAQEKTDKISHTYDAGVVTTVSTCLKEGVKTFTCTVCKETYTVSVNATGHSFNAQTTESTCTQTGYTIYTCQNENCDGEDGTKSYSYRVDGTEKKPHDYSILAKAETDGLCENTYRCSTCDATEKRIEHEKIGSEIVKVAICTASGEKVYKCDVCNKYLTKKTDIEGREIFETALDENGDNSKEIATRFEYTDNSDSAHSWSESTETKIIDGQAYYVYTCTNGCGQKKLELNTKVVDKKVIDSSTVKLNFTETGSGEEQEQTGEQQNRYQIYLDETAMKSLGEDSVTAFDIQQVGENQLTETQKVALKQYGVDSVYSVTAEKIDSENGNVSVSEFKDIDGKAGYVTVTVPYDGSNVANGETVYVLYLDSEGNVTPYDAVYKDGTATFTTTHFSYYYPTTLTAEQICALFGHSYSGVFIDRTCTEGAKITYNCTRCKSVDAVYTDDVAEYPALGHNFEGEGVITIQATCTEIGEKTFTCTRCEETKKEQIPSLGHDYQDEITNPTCTTNGYTTSTCTRCGDSFTKDFVSATGHRYSEGEITTQATCLAIGEKTFTCEICQAEKKESIQALGHDYSDEITEPTCTTAGYTNHSCSRCEHSYKDTYTNALNHDYSKAITEPTCIEQGYTTYTCTRCEHSYVSDYTSARRHSYQSVISKEATCIEKGETTYTCSNCTEGTEGHSYSEENIPAIGHSYRLSSTEWAEDKTFAMFTFVCDTCKEQTMKRTEEISSEITKEATCTAKGEKNYTAKVSINEKTYKATTAEIIAATGHNYQKSSVTEATCTQTGSLVYMCATCQKIKTEVGDPAKGHDYSGENGTVVTEPTCNEQGYTTYTCSRCEYSYKGNYIPASGHRYTEEKTDATCTTAGYTTYTCSNCTAETEGHTYTANAIPAFGHSYRLSNVEWADEKELVTFTFLCNICKELTKQESKEISSAITREATCTVNGIRIYTATVIFADKHYTETTTEDIKAKGHAYEDTDVSPTCEEKGYTKHTCSVCGDEYQDTYTAALGHDYIRTDWTWAEDYATATLTLTCSRNCSNPTYTVGNVVSTETVNEPTCEKDGAIRYRVVTTVNGVLYVDIKTIVTKADGHLYEDTIVNPTCTEKGYTMHTCSRCEHSYQDTYTAALGHDYQCDVEKVSWTENHQATFTFICSRCQNSFTREIVASEAVKQATCTETGLYTYTAKTNFEGKTFTAIVTEEIAALGHDYNEVVTEPTCTEQGYTTYTCSRCEHSYRDAYTNALGHDYNEVVTEPTCVKEGYTTSTCTRCGDSFIKDTVAKLGHDYAKKIWTWEGDGVEGYTSATLTISCSRCDSQLTGECEPTYKSIAATCEKDGSETYTAKVTVKGIIYTDSKVIVLAKTGHSFTDYIGNDDATCLKDGTKTAICDNGCYKIKTLTDEGSAKGHAYGTPEYRWLEDGTQCEAIVICTRACHEEGEIVTEQAIVECEIKTEATCLVMGWTTYRATFKNGLFFEQEKDVQDIPVIEHKQGAPVRENIVEATCREEGVYEEVVYCSACKEVLSRNKVVMPIVAHRYENGKCVMCHEAEPNNTLVLDNIMGDIGNTVAVKVKICGEKVSLQAIKFILYYDSEILTYLGNSDIMNDWGVTVNRRGEELIIACDRKENITAEGELFTLNFYLESEGESEISIQILDAAYTNNIGNPEYIEVSSSASSVTVKAHTWTQPVWNWVGNDTDGYSGASVSMICSTCQEKETFDANVYEIKYTPATCKQEGERVYHAEAIHVSVTEEKSVILPVVDHTYGEAREENRVESTCTEEGSYDEVVRCTVCDTVLFVRSYIIERKPHVFVQHESQEPTCTQIGWEEYRTCENCIYSEYKELSALGHDEDEPVRENEKAATCTEEGSYDEAVYCIRCRQELSRVENKIPVLNHSFIHHEAKEATCTEVGWFAYDVCERGDFNDYKEIPILGHSYGEPDYQWGENSLICVATVVCTRDCHEEGATVTEEATFENENLTKAVKTESTCTVMGWTTYVASFNNDLFIEQEKDVQDIPALGHSYGNPEYLWSEDGTECKAVVVCIKECDEEESTVMEQAAVSKEELYAATCTEQGEDRYIAVFQKEWFNQQSEQRKTPALGHAFGEWYVLQEAEADRNGLERRDCARCDFFETRILSALGHEYELIETPWSWKLDENGTMTAKLIFRCRNEENHFEEVDARVEVISETPLSDRCEREGTRHYRAIVEFEEERYEDNYIETLAVLGHSFTDYISDQNATCTEEGTKTAMCDHGCGKNDTVIDVGTMLPHNGGDPVRENEKAATCTEEGSYDEVVYCSVCRGEITRKHKTIEKPPHNFNDDQICKDCGFVTIQNIFGLTGLDCDKDNEVALTLSLRGNVKVQAFKLYLAYDIDMLCFERAESMLPGWNVTVGKYGGRLVIVCDSEENLTSASELLQLRFYASEIGQTSIQVQCDNIAASTEDGKSEYVPFKDTFATVSIRDHESFREAEENRVEATCQQEGYYDLVTYCSSCGKEISRIKKSIEKKEHLFDENGVCSECGQRNAYNRFALISKEGYVGDTMSLPLDISGQVCFQAFRLYLTYDRDILKFTGATSLMDGLTVTASDISGRLVLVADSENLFTERADYLVLNFNLIGEGITDISIEVESVAYRAESGAILYTASEASSARISVDCIDIENINVFTMTDVNGEVGEQKISAIGILGLVRAQTFVLSIEYNHDALTFVNVNIPEGSFLGYAVNDDGKRLILECDSSEELQETSCLLNLIFELKEESNGTIVLNVEQIAYSNENGIPEYTFAQGTSSQFRISARTEKQEGIIYVENGNGTGRIESVNTSEDSLLLSTIYNGSLVTEVAPNAFAGAKNVKNIYVQGREQDWKNLKVSYGNVSFLNSVLHFGTLTENTQASCTQEGRMVFVCEICKEDHIKVTPALEHEYEYRPNASDYSECEGGYQYYRCSLCRKASKTDRFAALGHNYENGVCIVCDEAEPDMLLTVSEEIADGDEVTLTVTLTGNIKVSVFRFAIDYDQTALYYLETVSSDLVITDGLKDQTDTTNKKIVCEFNGILTREIVLTIRFETNKAGYYPVTLRVIDAGYSYKDGTAASVAIRTVSGGVQVN